MVNQCKWGGCTYPGGHSGYHSNEPDRSVAPQGYPQGYPQPPMVDPLQHRQPLDPAAVAAAAKPDIRDDGYRTAVVTGGSEAAVARYLPSNYEVLSHDPEAGETIVGGRDSAGWTMTDYVQPRLQSGGFRTVPLTTENQHETAWGRNLDLVVQHGRIRSEVRAAMNDLRNVYGRSDADNRAIYDVIEKLRTTIEPQDRQ